MRTMPSTLPASTKLRDAAPVAGLTIGPSKFFSSAIDLEVLCRVPSCVGLHHRGGEMPVPALVFILESVGAEPVDERQHLGQVAALVPRLQALVNERAEVQVAVALERHELLEVSPLHRLPAVPEQRPHRVGGDHGSGAHRTPPRRRTDSGVTPAWTNDFRSLFMR